eukprot:1830005-Rhodomonas_salina.1
MASAVLSKARGRTEIVYVPMRTCIFLWHVRYWDCTSSQQRSRRPLRSSCKSSTATLPRTPACSPS